MRRGRNRWRGVFEGSAICFEIPGRHRIGRDHFLADAATYDVAITARPEMSVELRHIITHLFEARVVVGCGIILGGRLTFSLVTVVDGRRVLSAEQVDRFTATFEEASGQRPEIIWSAAADYASRRGNNRRPPSGGFWRGLGKILGDIVGDATDGWG